MGLLQKPKFLMNCNRYHKMVLGHRKWMLSYLLTNIEDLVHSSLG